MSEENQKNPAGNEDAKPPQLNVLTQYIKDFSFENPNAPASLQGGGSPSVDMQIGVATQLIQDGLHEVSLSMSINTKRDDATLFLVELVYAGLFSIENVPAESIEPILHIECTRLLFPFARRIIADATQDGGFPALPIEPIDFSAVYRARLEHAASEAGKNGNDPTQIN